MRRLLLPSTSALLLAAALVAAGCGGDTPATSNLTLDTEADSMAARMYRASGGPEVWGGVPALAFTFAVGSSESRNARQEVARHWWRRSDGAYRVEWASGPDSSYAAVFDVDEFDREPPTGRAMLNGARLDSVAEQRALRTARMRFANDSYWLLAPFKLFDEGVRRTLASDDPGRSDSAAVSGPALQLSFERVGLTPQDRYWLTPDSTGRLARWTFDLQGMGPEQPPGVFRWAGYETFSTPAGALTLSTRKENVGGPRVIYTDEIETPGTLPDSLFSIE